MPRGTGAEPGAEACDECRSWPEILLAARSASVLRSPADELVHALKYGGWRELAGFMGTRMAETFLEHFDTSDDPVVVPVPTTRTRERRRGYNQAALLAGAVSEALERPSVRALRRRPGGRTQVSLHPLERADNVRRAFRHRAVEAATIQGRRVILVDDVLTTGATASAAAGALEEGGARAVVLLTFTRALPFQDPG